MVAAGSSVIAQIFLLMQVEVETKLLCGCLSGTSLPVKFRCSVSDVMCSSCVLLFQCCPFSSAIPFRLGKEHASELVLELVLFFRALPLIPSSTLGAFNSICFSPLTPRLSPGLEETWESTRYKNLQLWSVATWGTWPKPLCCAAAGMSLRTFGGSSNSSAKTGWCRNKAFDRDLRTFPLSFPGLPQIDSLGCYLINCLWLVGVFCQGEKYFHDNLAKCCDLSLRKFCIGWGMDLSF